uniref:Uncharacterized protein n=1 Tax=Pyxicephalus adspersus TaxID=30357 RepID=A0AAV3ABS7_PYXAD|nr:TPA: hypothetical protein GDO54_012016 [Pyxicephalus adspersus]
MCVLKSLIHVIILICKENWEVFWQLKYSHFRFIQLYNCLWLCIYCHAIPHLQTSLCFYTTAICNLLISYAFGIFNGIIFGIHTF